MTTTETGTSHRPMTPAEERAAKRAADKPARDKLLAERRVAREEAAKGKPPKDPVEAERFADRERLERVVMALESLADIVSRAYSEVEALAARKSGGESAPSELLYELQRVGQQLDDRVRFVEGYVQGAEERREAAAKTPKQKFLTAEEVEALIVKATAKK